MLQILETAHFLEDSHRREELQIMYQLNYILLGRPCTGSYGTQQTAIVEEKSGESNCFNGSTA